MKTTLLIAAQVHDGFCLWPSKYDAYSVKNSPRRNGRGDVVKEIAAARRSVSTEVWRLSFAVGSKPIHAVDAFLNSNE